MEELVRIFPDKFKSEIEAYYKERVRIEKQNYQEKERLR